MHTVSVFAKCVYNSLIIIIKSTKKISNWTTVNVSSGHIWWLIIHNHAHRLLCTVMNSEECEEQLNGEVLAIFASQKKEKKMKMQ